LLVAVLPCEAIFGPGVAQRIRGHFAVARSEPLPFPALTPRERLVLDRIAAGQRNAQIAQALSISPKTVSNHVSSIFAKLAVTDRAEAIVRARESGLGHGATP